MVYRLAFILIIILTLPRATTVSGHVRDSVTKKSIPNANIYIMETGQGMASDPYGYFELEIPNGAFTLVTSVIGFKTDSREIIIKNENDIKLIIGLQTEILEYSELRVRGLFNTRLGYESVDVINSDEIISVSSDW